MSVEPEPVLWFQTLGPLQVMRGDEVLRVGSPLQRVLLAALLTEGPNSVQVPVLMDRLWADDPPETAVKSIHKYISNLRRILGDERIVSNGGYRLVVEPDEVDAWQFERALAFSGIGARDPVRRLAQLNDALALWRGEPFADLTEPLFLEPIRVRMAETKLAIIEERLSVLLELGRFDQVSTESGVLVDAHPLRERFWQLRMSSLAATGRQAEALAEFQRLRATLGNELGLEPSPESAALEERILLQDPILAPTARVQGNLPASSASVIARSADLEQIEAFLGHGRLVTIVGTAGVGKTTLALELARRVSSAFEHGAWFVGLGPITEPERVAGRMAETLSVVESSGLTVAEVVADFLARRQALIVIDNCEHVVDGVAELVVRLLGKAPEIVIIATSRQALNVPGEIIFDLGGLGLPIRGSSTSETLESPAVQLLAARAGEAGARLALDDDVEALAEIARHLDGVPLALELAAARLRFISPIDLSQQLETHITALAADRRGVPDRQQTLEAAIDWSFRLLEDDESRLLTRLSVFRGGFTLDAVQRVSGWDLVDATAALERLVGHSLVTILSQPGASHRYQLLWVIRLFAESRIGDELAVVRRRHADYYLKLVEPEDPMPLHPPARAITELLTEYENLRAAMTFLLETDGVAGLRLAAALGAFWIHAGALSEAQAWLEKLLPLAGGGPAQLRVRALMALAEVYDPISSEEALRISLTALAEARDSGETVLIASAAYQAGRMHALRLEREDARPLIEEALATFEAIGDNWGIALCHEALGLVYRGSDEDIGHYETAIRLYRELGNEPDLAQTLFSMAYRSLIPNGMFDRARAAVEESAGLAIRLGSRQQHVHALTALGQLTRLQGPLDLASDILNEALTEVREIGDRRCTVRMLTALARIDLSAGRPASARERLGEATRVGIQLDGGLSSDTHELVDALGLLALANGELEQAARWLGAAESIRIAQGLVRSPPDRVVIQEALDDLEARLGQSTKRRLLTVGATLSLEQVAAEAALDRAIS